MLQCPNLDALAIPPRHAEMVDHLMLQVQAALQPRITWQCVHTKFQHVITLQWQTLTSQLQLVAYATSTGMTLWLYDWLGDADQLRGRNALVSWTVKSTTDGHGWQQACRRERVNGQFMIAELSAGDPTTCGLRIDVVKTTQEWLYAAGIASRI